MKLSENAIQCLLNYNQNKEGVYQVSDEMMEVSNSENRQFLLDNLNCAQFVEVYYKGAKSLDGKFSDLIGWAADDDVFFLVESLGVLMCMPRKSVVENKILEN